MKKKNHLFDNVFTVREAKASSVILIFMVTGLFALVMYYFDRDISGNLLTWMVSLLSIVGGVDITQRIVDAVKTKKSEYKTEDDGKYDSRL